MAYSSSILSRAQDGLNFPAFLQLQRTNNKRIVEPPLLWLVQRANRIDTRQPSLLELGLGSTWQSLPM